MDTVLPLEQTDPELAEHFRLIANRQHPAVHSVSCCNGHITITPYLQRPIIRKIKVPGRNDPCHCGSGRKYKKCCGE